VGGGWYVEALFTGGGKIIDRNYQEFIYFKKKNSQVYGKIGKTFFAPLR
jgi:hypothetical protein